MDGGATGVSAFTLDSQVEVWRSIPGILPWYLEWEGFYRTGTWSTESSGKTWFEAECVGYNDLLRRAIVTAQVGTAGSQKDGAAETIIKAYVDENIGPGAGVLAMPGLTVQADGATGVNVWKNEGLKNLFDTCKSVAKDGLGDFAIVGTGPATFEFRWYNGQMGVDRTIGNIAVRPPVIFSLKRGNMDAPKYTLNRTAEANTVYVGGSGTSPARVIRIVADAPRAADSPWNRCVVFRQGGNTADADTLDSFGQEELDAKGLKEVLDFDAMQTSSTVYGKDFFLGDKVSAQYGTATLNYRITKTELSFEAGQSEQLKIQIGSER